MSDEMNQEQQLQPKKRGKREMSRRQFLSYTLGGTGAFMAGMPLIFNLRFAVDPLLKKKEGSEYVKVVEEAKITNEPQVFKFDKEVVDGWYVSNPTFEAWISRGDDGQIFALSPVCKHLGCTVNWNSNTEFPNEYYCPCHGAHYTKDGEALEVAPKPLDEYEVKVDNGYVYLGPIVPNRRV